MTDYKDKIILGDCLENMAEMPDNCVDVTFTSPPYAEKGRGEFQTTNPCGTHRKYKVVESYVGEEWYDWQIKVINECLRLSKKWVIYNIGCMAHMRPYIYKLIGYYADRIHDILVWAKPNGLPCGTPKSISNTYEFIFLIKKNPKDVIHTNSDFFRNVINLPVNNNEFSNIHHAVMSKSLSDLCIKEFTSEGDLVLDPFMGLGTTALSCLQQNRHYIGFEIYELYYNKCLARVEGRHQEVGSDCDGLIFD